VVLVASSTAVLTPDEAVERARALVPVVAERAAKAEALRRLPDETFADLTASGLLRITQPRRFGGSELPLPAARIDAAETLIRGITERATADVAAHGAIKPETRVRNRRDSVFGARLCVEAVEELFLAAGAGSLDESLPLQRHWRDVHAVAQHIANNRDRSLRAWGEYALGLGDGLSFT
jgi:alkylation response protein AidB-like acyl-CoA dehydrogenase